MVVKATHKKDGKQVAIKCVHKLKMDAEDREMLRNEVEIMKMLQHDYIVKLYDVFESKEEMYIVME